MNLIWSYKNFDELSTKEVYAILQLRNEIFVVEQNCVYPDVDNKDQQCHHLMVFDGCILVAYSRIIPPGLSYPEASIGRVATAMYYRGKGIGRLLIEKAIENTFESFAVDKIKIGAQFYLKKFYEDFGFVQTSDVYLDDGIEHIDMLLDK